LAILTEGTQEDNVRLAATPSVPVTSDPL